MKETKSVVSYEETFAQLDIRLGKIIEVEDAKNALKKSYLLDSVVIR